MVYVILESLLVHFLRLFYGLCVPKTRMEDWEAAYFAGMIDGEGSITLTRIHMNEHRRPCITIASTDKDLLDYVQTLSGGDIIAKKNDKPGRHKDSYTLSIKNNQQVLSILKHVIPYLRVEQKKKKAQWIVAHYEKVTPRNGKYSPEQLQAKLAFENHFFQI